MPEQRKSFFDWLVSPVVELREDCVFVFIYVCVCVGVCVVHVCMVFVCMRV